MDWFGSGFTVMNSQGDYVEVTLSAPPDALKYWALQYGENVEVLEPLSLRESVKEAVKKMAIKYNS